MKESNKIINSLWIGKTLSNVELLTIKSFVANGHDFYLWTYDELDVQFPEGVFIKDANTIIPHERVFRYKNRNQFGHGKGSLGGFSDIFRYKLLYECGGWWVDMDVTCLKPFDFEVEYVFRKHHELSLVGNMMKCPKGSELMRLCYEKAVEEVDENNTDWHKPINILNEFVKKLGLEIFIKDFSNQDIWADISVLIHKRKDIHDNWRAIHWANEEWRKNNIDKDYYKQNSCLGQFMIDNGLLPKEISFLKKILYIIKLSRLFQLLISLKWHLKWSLTSGRKEQN